MSSASGHGTGTSPTISTVPVIDRADIQKSLKALDAVMTSLYEYSQLATMVAAAHKKLGRTLKDMMACKGTGAAASKAFTSSASIFDALSDIDQKFVKILDKEYETMSTDLRKCIKKISKEERNLDDYMADSKKAIRQAGETYEKKSRRKDKDIADEHARWTTLLSRLGAEMADTKHQHGLFVTHKHNTISFAVAAALARVAEGEWVRTCESVRRCSSAVGPLGEARAHCEGGTVFFPDGLPDLASIEEEPALHTVKAEGVAGTDDKDRTRQALDKVAEELRVPAPSQSLAEERGIASRSQSSANLAVTMPIPHRAPSTRPSTPPLSFGGDHSSPSETHHPTTFASPAYSSNPPSPAVSMPKMQIPTPMLHSTPTGLQATALRSTPTGTTKSVTTEVPFPSSSSGDSASSNPSPFFSISKSIKATVVKTELPIGTATPPESPLVTPRRTAALPSSEPTLVNGILRTGPQPEGILKKPEMADKYEEEISATPSADKLSEDTKVIATKENGIGSRPPLGHRGTAGVARALSMESTASNNSMVAVMRDRYVDRERTHLPPASPPPTRDFPRPSSRVSDLASRYTPVQPEPTSSIGSLASLKNVPGAFPLGSNDRYPSRTIMQEAMESRSPEAMRGSPSAWKDASPERRWSRDRGDAREFGGLMPPPRDSFDNERERERDMVFKERELQLRREELELEKQRMRYAQGGPYNGPYNGSLSVASASSSALHQSRSYTTMPPLPTPSPSGRNLNLRRTSSPPAPQRYSPDNPLPAVPRSHATGHSASCGCYECSARQYAQPPSPATHAQQLPPAPPIELRPQKERTWLGKGLRRLSMPVGEAFSLDGRKPSATSPMGISNTGVGGTMGKMPVPETDPRIGRRSFEGGNASATPSVKSGTYRR